MKTKYQAFFSIEVVDQELKRLIGQIYKLLPQREEGVDWQKPLQTIQHELAGLQALFPNYLDFQKNVLILECNLEGLYSKAAQEDFELFRKSIFDCIGKTKKIREVLSCLD